MGMPYVLARSPDGQLRAFHNVRSPDRAQYCSAIIFEFEFQSSLCPLLPAVICRRCHEILALIGGTTLTGLQTPCSSSGLREWIPGLLHMPLSWLDIRCASLHPILPCFPRESADAYMSQLSYMLLPAGLDGRLRRAPHMRGVENFQAADYGLKQIQMEIWGHFVFLNFDSNGKWSSQTGSRLIIPAQEATPGICLYWMRRTGSVTFDAQLGLEGLQAMEAAGITDDHLVHVASRAYSLQCNWKVFCDNYLVRIYFCF